MSAPSARLLTTMDLKAQKTLHVNGSSYCLQERSRTLLCSTKNEIVKLWLTKCLTVRRPHRGSSPDSGGSEELSIRSPVAICRYKLTAESVSWTDEKIEIAKMVNIAGQFTQVKSMFGNTAYGFNRLYIFNYM